MTRTLIIGYGNPLRGDDGLGWYAAERLKTELDEEFAAVMCCHQLTPELAEPISQAELVIFIDAETREPAGRLFCRQIGSVAEPPACFSHHLTPVRLLSWAGELFGRAPEAMVFSVSGENFGVGETLSPAISKVLPQLIEQVSELVRCREKRRMARSNDRAEQGHA
jgi:hydrogenase maturation protease